MNLFVTDTDPVRAATHLDDKRVVKIILESAQILSTVLHWRGVRGFYKPTHTGHPVTVWAAAEPRNAAWALRYGLALCEEYRAFGRQPVHGCEPVLLAMRRHIRYTGREPEWFQNSARNQSVPVDFSHLPVVTAYRRYLCVRWAGDARAPTWNNRRKPRWARY